MISIYQTIFNNGFEKNTAPGNCLQAAVASLLDLKLDDVPHFLLWEDWFGKMREFLKEQGYHYERSMHNPRDLGYDGSFKTWVGAMKRLNGINGYFLATVHSPKYFNPTAVCDFGSISAHAVIIDKQFNIVHDPNPNYAGTKEYPMHKALWPNGVMAYDVINRI